MNAVALHPVGLVVRYALAECALREFRAYLEGSTDPEVIRAKWRDRLSLCAGTRDVERICYELLELAASERDPRAHYGDPDFWWPEVVDQCSFAIERAEQLSRRKVLS